MLSFLAQNTVYVGPDTAGVVGVIAMIISLIWLAFTIWIGVCIILINGKMNRVLNEMHLHLKETRLVREWQEYNGNQLEQLVQALSRATRK